MSRLADTVTIQGREVSVPVTLADRLVNWWDPVRGAQRYQTRLRMAISGGYTGADKTRRANQLGGKREMSAASAILPDLATLRSEAQHMERNNPVAGGALAVNVTKVVGAGLKVKSQLDRELLGLSDDEADRIERAAEREFKLAAETPEFDIERKLPFSLMQGLVFLRVLGDGDILVNLPRLARPGSIYRTKLQCIEAARICNPQFKPDSDTLAAGVQMDPVTGAAEICHVLNRHPNERIFRQQRAAFSWTPVRLFAPSGRPLALHLFDKRRPGQPRGVPYLAPVIELIKQLGRYTDAEVMAAVVTGMLTVLVTNDSGDPRLGPAPTTDNPDGSSAGQVDTTGIELGYGSIVGLQYGDQVHVVNPSRPNTAFDPFFFSVMRQIGMLLEVPVEVLIKHFTASYSAAKASLEEAWSYFNRRRSWLVSSFCQPVYEAVITEAVERGRLSMPGFFADPLVRAAWLGATWLGGPKTQLDELKEVNAAAKRIELTITTLDEESRKMTGTPWEDKLPQVLKERQILRAHGIITPVMEQVAGADENENGDDESAGDLETIERTKQALDAYGVGVRAGAFTPQQDDENHFRSLLRIPAATPVVTAAWDDDGGTRRQVTLKSGKEAEAEADAADDKADPDREQEESA